jgi:hypothetical protein
MACFPVLFAPGWIWLMDRNYHGAPRIARMIQCTHVLTRLKSDIPLKRTSEILPDGSYRAELSGDGVTVKVRVIEYWVTVEGQEVLGVIQHEHRRAWCDVGGVDGVFAGFGLRAAGVRRQREHVGNRPALPVIFWRSPGRAVRVRGGTIAHGRQQRGRCGGPSR